MHSDLSVAQDLAAIRCDYKPGEITHLCDEVIAETTRALEDLVHLPADKHSFENTFLAFEKITADFSDRITPLTFMAYISTDDKMSEEASRCEEKISQFSVSIYTRKDLYHAFIDQKSADPRQMRLAKETIEAFEDNGLSLADEDLKKIKDLKQSLASLETQFSTHLNRDESFVDYRLEELIGVPEDFIQSLEKGLVPGTVRVTTKEPHFVRIMENAELSETRRKMMVVYDNRAAQTNIPLIEKAIELRQKIAHTMGYKNWVDCRTHRRMAKDSASVAEFLNHLKDKLAAKTRAELDHLLHFKQTNFKQVESKSESESGTVNLHAWDLRFLDYQLRKQDYQLDDEKIREFFPADTVLKGLFDVYSRLLGVDFIRIHSAVVWSPDVQLYLVRNSADQNLIGYFYADFIPRKGKYGHAAAFPLKSGRLLASGQYARPISAIVANFSAAEGDKPILLSHDEVKVLFHEFGHIMHQTLTRAPYASLSGSNVDQDFVEAPSQMLENWVYSPEILRLLSGHYLDKNRKLPDSLIQQMIRARDFNQSYIYTRQLLFGLFDLKCHSSSEPVDVCGLYRDLFRELLGLETVPESHWPASFGHLMGGYDAGYYGYLWSKVYAEDMFLRFEKEGLMNPKVGQDYRRWVLESGKMIDAFEILENFLGRKPNSEAFYRKLHLKE